VTLAVMHAGSYRLHWMLLKDVGRVASKGWINSTARATDLHYRWLVDVAECIDASSLALRPSYIVKLGLHMGRAFNRVIPTLGSPWWCGSPCSMEELGEGRKLARKVLLAWLDRWRAAHVVVRSDHVSQRPFGRMRGVHLARVQRFTVAVRNILESKIFHVFNGNTA